MRIFTTRYSIKNSNISDITGNFYFNNVLLIPNLNIDFTTINYLFYLK
ncbi:hypothetical protein PROSTU_03143 [Providencia stuartii ATCC 25827]|uniref:Uncharacterized protein n=1 Tax=Providencia stuartii ATCC 25827 TaxID=471874 RepID=A0AA86YXK1_PROST|nr:hypothetical protein PROSTU_03143 [Providencia stuartii ATCC 25827]